MDRYVVNITNEAISDMERIYNYIASELLSPETALSQYNRIADAILKLEFFPEKCPLFDIEPERTWGIRRMHVDNYIVCYIIDSDKVTITDVLYGASNIHIKLMDRHT